MNKYMLSIQHTNQKVTYIEFKSGNDNTARVKGDSLLAEYKRIPRMVTSSGRRYGKTQDGIYDGVVYSGNHGGFLPPETITNTWLSKFVKSDTACDAWGRPCGGYWQELESNGSQS